MGRRRRTILSIVVAATVGGAAPGGAARAQTQPAPAPQGQQQATAPSAPSASPPARPPAPPRADVAGDLAALRAVLTQPDARPADREQAAARLVSRDRPEADDILRAALSGDVRDARLAVARALADDPTPSEAMVAPLAEQLRYGVEQKSNALVEAGATALANYRGNGDALGELVRFAGDGAQPADARARVVRALGRVVEPEAARTLVLLLRTAALRAAAADALVDMTGLSQNGSDAERWTAWLQANAPAMANNRDRWRAQLLDARAARYERLRRRHDALVDADDERMAQQYQAAPREQRAGTLLSFLTSEQPDERAAAARLVTRAFKAGDPINEPVRDRLVALVGDSDEAVRYDVAVTLTNLNHRPALSAELTQLAQERDERVKVALVEAVGRIEDPAAAPQLAAMLANETSPRVIAAIANALGRIGRDLRKTDAAAADGAIRRLRDIAGSRNRAADLRVAALDALGALQDPELPSLAQNLLAGNQADPSLAVRRATLHALGNLTGPVAAEGAEIISATLRAGPREPELRAEALDALGRVGNLPEHGGVLIDYTESRNELDEAVRQHAREAYQATLPRATPAQLAREQYALKNNSDLARRAAVLEELCKQLENSPDKQDLATSRVDLGTVYASENPPQLAKAILNLRQGLTFYLRNGAGENVTTPLIEQLIKTYLASKDYAATAQFGQEMIRTDPRNKDSVGRAIKNEADRLRGSSDPRGAQDALRLIDEALKMDPPLDERHVEDLRRIRQEIGSPQ